LWRDVEGGVGTHFIAILMMVGSAVMVLWNLQDSSLENANTGSRYATVESLVDYGTYHIDKSRYVRTIDKMKVGDNFISSKPAALPTYAAGVYWVYKKVTGHTIATHEGPVVWLVSLCTGWLFHMLSLVYLYRLVLLLMKRQAAILGTMAVACFGYLGTAYATAINNHSTAGALALVGFYYAYRAHRFNNRSRDWLYAGLALGVAGAFDLSSLAYIPFVGLYLLFRDWKRALLLFGAALVPGMVLMFGLNHHITGSYKPTYTNQEIKKFAGNYFKHVKSGIDALREKKHIYAFNVLLGHHGLFSMTPVFFFSAYEMVQRVRRKGFRAETLALGSVVLAFVFFYIFRSRNYGGWCVGMRWLVPVMLPLVLFFGLWLERVRLTRVVIAVTSLSFAVGCFHVQDGLSSPFQFSMWHNWLEKAPNRGRVGKRFNFPARPAPAPASAEPDDDDGE
jgi:4-amino-4-deoxy-L-arabinose transferase-like glycosyltransferase